MGYYYDIHMLKLGMFVCTAFNPQKNHCASDTTVTCVVSAPQQETQPLKIKHLPTLLKKRYFSGF